MDKQKPKDIKRVKECYEILINDKYKIKNINIMKEKYKIEIHESTSFYKQNNENKRKVQKTDS